MQLHHTIVTKTQPLHADYPVFIFRTLEAAQAMRWISTMDCGSAKNIAIPIKAGLPDYYISLLTIILSAAALPMIKSGEDEMFHGPLVASIDTAGGIF